MLIRISLRDKAQYKKCLSVKLKLRLRRMPSRDLTKTEVTDYICLCRFLKCQHYNTKRSSEIFQTPFFQPFKLSATASTIGAATAFTAVVLKLQLSHDRCVGIMPALTGNVVFIIWDTGHQVRCQLDGFPPRCELMLHSEPPAVYRRGTLLEFL